MEKALGLCCSWAGRGGGVVGAAAAGRQSRRGLSGWGSWAWCGGGVVGAAGRYCASMTQGGRGWCKGLGCRSRGEQRSGRCGQEKEAMLPPRWMRHAVRLCGCRGSVWVSLAWSKHFAHHISEHQTDHLSRLINTQTHPTTAMSSIRHSGLLLLVLLAFMHLVVQGFVPAARVPARQVSRTTGLDLRVQPMHPKWYCVRPNHLVHLTRRRTVW